MSDASKTESHNGSGNGHAPHDTQFDQTWPVFTVEGAGARQQTTGDQTPNVATVLRDLLGWRPIPGDAKGFSAALAASFTLTQVEGHVESQYVPRGFAMQADLGSVSGGQASLYARARASLTHMLELLDGLTPLQPAVDQDEADATRALVRNELSRIVQEIGMPGGPRQVLIDSSFEVLLGSPSPAQPTLPDKIGGQLGALRNEFGLVQDYVNTPEDESIRTAFWTLADETQDLYGAWSSWKNFLATDSENGFLGTDFVLISRLMEAASEQVDEYEDVLESVLVGAAERQTIELDERGLTLDGLLGWTRRFLREDGPSYLTDSGRIGLRNAFEPTSAKIVQTYLEQLICPLGLTEVGDCGSEAAYGSRLPALPAGLSAARSKIALTSLYGLLRQIKELACTTDPARMVIGNIELTVGRRARANAQSVKVTVSVRVAEVWAKRDLMIGFVGKDGRLIIPEPGTQVQDGGRLQGVFVHEPAARPALAALLEPGNVVELGRNAVPLVILDRATGQMLFKSPISDWDEADLTDRRPPGAGPSTDWMTRPNVGHAL